jgi:hypothetical protein
LPVRNLADLTSPSYSTSEDKPGQWVCWAFHELRVRPTHCTIRGLWLKSWVIESSLDRVNWTEINRKTDNNNFKNGWARPSFAVSKPAECRFIRLIQTGKNHHRDDHLYMAGFEIFGALLE